MIELHNVTVSRFGRKLFDQFSLTIQSNEHWVIQGANGSGKTALLDVIAGSLLPSTGEIKYSFVHADDWQERYNARQQNIHYIPAHALQVFLSGYQGLFYQQRYYSIGDTNVPKVKDFFGTAVDKLHDLKLPPTFDISGLMELELTRLSNGQLKKVLILHSLAKNIPKFLLLDYPFEGLDADSRNDLMGFIDQIAIAFNIQMIMVDHHHELPRVINRRLVLQNFKIMLIEDVISSPHKTLDEPTLASTKGEPKNNHPPVVELQDLTIQYGNKKIIEGLNWTINKGERWALTGKNGSGKTTLFSLLYADHPLAYSQKVFLFGKRRGSGESIWDIKKRINYLGPEQIHFLNPKSITIPGRQYIMAQHNKNDDRLTQLIDFFDAAGFIDSPVKHLSSGQLQVMLLLNFFINDKELLLLDEPFQFLDDQSKEKTTEYLNYYLDSNVTLVLIAHYEKDIRRWTQLKISL
jgi:molybdate transport system ATP-binding protein